MPIAWEEVNVQEKCKKFVVPNPSLGPRFFSSGHVELGDGFSGSSKAKVGSRFHAVEGRLEQRASSVVDGIALIGSASELSR